MKKFLLPAFLFLFLVFIYQRLDAQEVYTTFFEQHLKSQNTGMYVLGTWAVTNLIVGAYGWSAQTGESKYFHQMNFFWNTVNLSIAGISLYSNYSMDPGSFSSQELLDKALKTERLFLINAGLDVLYVGTGFLLRGISDRYTNRRDLLNGYGKSLLLQGSFLLVFDLVMYGVLRHQHFTRLEGLSLKAGENFCALSWAINF